MSKKFIIITAAAGLVSFAGAFVFALLRPSVPAGISSESGQPASGGNKSQAALQQPQSGGISTVAAASGPITKAMTEQELKNLILDIRGKIQEYNNKLQAIGVRERRLQLTQDMLKKDIEDLNSLRIELASTIANLKSERDKLIKSRLQIDQTEKSNLVSIAATYDKMDVSGASKILTNMCAAQILGKKQAAEAGNVGGSFDDAVKILYYMSERTKAKLLAELATSEPALAAALCKRLKQIVEGT
jgi:flagellar motility protein MotE (MotC chaperone)